MSVEGTALFAFFDEDVASASGDALVGRDADKGVAADVLAAFDGLEQKGFGGVVGDAKEGRDGGFEVGRDGAEDGDEGVVPG